MASVTAPQYFCQQPSESRLYSMDFAALMSSSETIEASSPAPVVTSELEGGGTSDLTIGTPSIDGQKVKFRISGGTHAKDYRIEVVIETSDENTLSGDGVLQIRDE